MDPLLEFSKLLIDKGFISAVAAVLVGLATAQLVVRQYFLLTKERKDASQSDRYAIRRQIEKQVERAAEDLEKRILDANSQADIDRRIKEITQGFSLDELFQGRETEIWERFNQTQFGVCVNQIRDNMESYRDANRQQYVRNLLAGLGLSAFAVLVALFLVITRPSVDLDNPSLAIIQLLISYFPYITMIIVVEVLAFFFLKLYSQNVEVERFIRNEISSLNAKLAAIFMASRSEDEVFRQNLIAQLFATERNQLLQNGATTVEIEKARLDAQSFKDGAGFFASLNPANVVSDVVKATTHEGKQGK